MHASKSPRHEHVRKIPILCDWNSIFRLAFAVLCCKFIIRSKIELVGRQTIEYGRFVCDTQRISIPTKQLTAVTQRTHTWSNECGHRPWHNIQIQQTNVRANVRRRHRFYWLRLYCASSFSTWSNDILSLYLCSTTIMARRGGERGKQQNSSRDFAARWYVWRLTLHILMQINSPGPCHFANTALVCVLCSRRSIFHPIVGRVPFELNLWTGKRQQQQPLRQLMHATHSIEIQCHIITSTGFV